MRTFDKLLWAVVATFLILATSSMVVAFVSPDFRDNGASFVVPILTCVTAFATAMGLGSYLSRGIRAAPEEEAKKREEVGGGEE